MGKAGANYVVEFPSIDAAWHFSVDANEAGWKTNFEEEDIVRIFPSGSITAIILGAILGGLIFGLMGWLSEAGTISLPRLEPLFSSPHGAVTMFFAAFGISIGFLFTSLAVIKPVPSMKHINIKTAHVIASGKDNSEELQNLAEEYGGYLLDNTQQLEDRVEHSGIKHREHKEVERR